MIFSFSDTQGFLAATYHEMNVKEIETFWQRCGFWLLDCVR